MKLNRNFHLTLFAIVLLASPILITHNLNLISANLYTVEERDTDIKSAEFVSMKVSGYIKNYLGNTLYNAKVTISIYTEGTTRTVSTYTNLNGYYEYHFSAELSVSITIKAEKAGYTTRQKTLSGISPRIQPSVYINVNLPVESTHENKIGVFFWASDSLHDDNIINEYINVLKKEGFTSFFKFKDTGDYITNFNAIDSHEDSNDIIFLYIKAHGDYNPSIGESYSELGSVRLHSSVLLDELDDLEANHIGFLVESCKSGGFVTNSYNTDYLAISSSNIEKESYDYIVSREGYFSDEFFDAVNDGDSANSAYWEARSSYKWYPHLEFYQTIGLAQSPLWYNGCSYNFFGPPPSSDPPPSDDPPSDDPPEIPTPPPGGLFP